MISEEVLNTQASGSYDKEYVPSALKRFELIKHNLGVNHSQNRGGGVRILTGDTGCSLHPNLNHIENLGSYFGIPDFNNGLDTHGHGTGMVGIIGAIKTIYYPYEGIAPDAQIFSLKIYDEINGVLPSDIINTFRLAKKIAD